MSAVDRSGLVQIVLGGSVETVPYRRAVGLIASGRASWYKDEPAPVVEKPKKPRPERVEAPPAPELPVQVHVPGETLPPLPEAAYAPDAVPLPPARKKPGKPDVSTPARKGAEGDLAGNEPPPIDP